MFRQRHLFYFSALFLFLDSISVFAISGPDFGFLEQKSQSIYACSSVSKNKGQFEPLTALSTTYAADNCEISAYQAYKQFNERQYLLIDVRSEAEFKKISIPGSLNIPAYALKAKAFLKDKKLILIDDGRQSSALNTVCQALLDEGIQVEVVSGGLNGWSNISNEFIDDKNAITHLNEISPAAFYPMLFQPDSLLIALSDTSAFSQLSPILKQKAHTIQPEQDLSSLTQQIKQRVAHSPVVRRIFIVNYDGRIKPSIKSHLKNQFRQPIFYLTGGMIAFEQYQNTRAAMLKRLKYPPQPLYRCRG